MMVDLTEKDPMSSDEEPLSDLTQEKIKQGSECK